MIDVKRVRKRLKLNQTEFGKLIGVSLRSVQMYEKGDTKPSAEVLLRILKLEPQNYPHFNEPEAIYKKQNKTSQDFEYLAEKLFVKLKPFLDKIERQEIVLEELLKELQELKKKL